ncbi:MAG: TauD/TfdA family dioxygenase [Proteobacteria bacterium]|nr:TauD/TfdA family dioxygenase [Pseudomonadota bacterium]
MIFDGRKSRLSYPICPGVADRPNPRSWASNGRNRVNGLAVGESEELLDALWAHVAAQEAAASWHHSWRVGDLLIWDNRRVMHRRNAFPPESRRVMHRTQIKGEKPI